MLRKSSWIRPLLAALTLCALPACKGGNGLPASAVPQVGEANPFDVVRPLKASGLIQHVIVIVQENRSFNNLFYGYPGAPRNLRLQHSTGKRSRFNRSARNYLGSRARSLRIRSRLQRHRQGPGTNCKMNGFDNENWTCGPGPNGRRVQIKYPPYSYVPHRK